MYAYTLTLTSANTNYRIATLITAIDSAVPTNVASITVKADSANAGIVLLGDASLASTRYGIDLANGASTSLNTGSGINDQSTSNIYARSSTAAQVIHVTLHIT